MDRRYISAFAALAGTAIGGLASFTTSWVTQQAQSRAQRRAAERDSRAALFGRFLDEAAKLYSDALQTSRDDVTGLIAIYALTNRIRLLSTPQVVEAADTVVRIIVDTYLAPNITLHEMRDELDRSDTSIRCGILARLAGKSCRRSDGGGGREVWGPSMRKLVIACLVQFALLTQAHAWGPEGHSIVAEIAQRRLSPEAAAKVREILGENASLASIASWADDYRALHLDSAGWHFVDISLAAEDYEEGRDCAPVAARRLRHSRARPQPARFD